MNLRLVRSPSNASCTIGKLYVDGVLECFVLEDVVRPTKIAGRTAIPAGKYKVVITMSPRFGKLMPLLLNVPNYAGVRIHKGNTAEDTEGCLLPGLTNPTPYTVGNSGKAYDALFAKLQKALLKEEVWIEVI